MKRLEKMTIDELISILGSNLTDNNIPMIFNEDAKAIQAFQELVAIIKVRNARLGIINKGNKFIIEEVLRKMDSEINRYVLVLLTLYNSQNDLESKQDLTKEERRELEEKIKVAMKLIGSKDFTVIETIREGDFIRSEIINSTRLIRCIKSGQSIIDMDKPNKRQVERLEEIKEKVGLENVVIGLIIEDIMSCVGDLEIARGILNQISWNALHSYAKSHTEINLDEIVETNGIAVETEEMLYQSPEMRTSMLEAIEQNWRYIDSNRLLVLSWARLINLLERDVDNNLKSMVIEENGKERIEGKEGTVNGITDIIEGILKVLDMGIEVEIGNVKYTVKNIEKSLKRFRDGRYIRGEEIEEAKKRMLSGETSLMGEDDEVLAVMEINAEEAETLIRTSEENIFFLVSKGIMEEEEIKPALYIRGECSQKLFSFINRKGMLRYEDMLELFEAGIITNDMVLSIKDDEIRRRLENDIRTRVRECYLASLDKDNNKPEEIIEKFNRFATLYKKMNVIGKTEKEVLDESFLLISSFEEDLTTEVLQGLYQFGIIPLEAAADWGADITEMLSENSIKPTDVKSLFAKKVISIETIKDVLKGETLSYEEKLDLIYSTFDGETEEEERAREELIDFLGIGESHKAETNGYKKIIRTGMGVKAKEFITDPHARWKLISLLDKDYSKKFLPKGKEVIDGHRVFLLPNQEKILIERMHEKRAGKRVSAYGSATYIMDTDMFFENMDTIIKNGAINRTFLRELSEEEKASKIIHSKYWGEAITRYFEVTPENVRYTKEDIIAINKAIGNIEKSRKERE